MPIGSALAVNTTLDTTAPSSAAGPPAYSTATGTQNGRLSRNSIPSDCLTSKAVPGLFATTGARQYDSYTFTNAAATPACVTVTLTTPQNENTSALLAAAYGAGGFVPTAPDQNYLADAGSSPNTQTPTTFSFLAPAGQQFTIVVHELNAGSGTGVGLGAYTLKIGGPGFGIVTGDGGSSVVPLHMPIAMAKEYLMLAKPFTAAELAARGIVNYAVSAEELDAKTDEIVQALLRRSAYALAWTKRTINRRVADQLNMTLDASAAYEMVNFLQIGRLGGKDPKTL